MTSIKLQKNEIRSELLRVRCEIPPKEKETAQERIVKSFFSLASVRYAKNILLYSPINGELDVLSLARTAVGMGKRIAFPVSDPKEPKMEFFFVENPDQLKKGAFGINEPADGCEKYTLDGCCDVCVVPAVSFDCSGHRLGYGKGYYDRFLSGFRGVKIGLCMEKLLRQKLPSGRFDIPMDVIITERRVMIPNEK